MIAGSLYLLLVLHSITHQLTAAAPVATEGNGEDGHHAAPPVGIAQMVEGPVGVGTEAEGNSLGHIPTPAEEQPLPDAEPKVLAASLLGALRLPQGKGEEEVKGTSSEEEAKQEEERSLQGALEELRSYSSPVAGRGGRQQGALWRAARGYFPNIDLGLQDNEILPPLRGYKLYNQELARAGKKMKWQEDSGGKNGPLYNTVNPAPPDDDDIFAQEEEEVEEEMLTREEEEARARAEQEEIRRQVAEAQRNREEEAKLADIASDMLLQYMVKKQGGAGGYPARRRPPFLGNAVEDKRSEEEGDEDEDEVDPQTIDKLIEISSKLHLPADDVVDIISDQAPYLGPYSSPSRKWYQDKAKMKAGKQKYWGKPPKQLLAYPSYPFYQKPYRAYYPVYFPSPQPKSRYYAKPVLSIDDLLGNSMDYDFKPPKRRYNPWKRPAPPRSPYISNYILPHPRTYQALPVPKPRPPMLQRQSLYYLPAAAAVATREEEFYGQAGQQDSDEELENFIEKVYMKRRMYK
ncbi:hypothetical protein SKAU_G00321760 [Synaphobranchus kaupii]|uniref:VGF nerve growth factor inducible n=1 Tax=Synaphobranchus kaupii TaxID=118154 RepID=A0A9Q1ENT4_SYNKA|nr:hypothetical protein SKAU_G00321760 [Synaphobranchus kaupii]